MKIIIGLIVFLILITFPIWYNAATGKANYQPELVIETKDVPGKDQCVLPSQEMRESHMDLLNTWREKVVRDGERIHTTPDGRKFNMSLTKTCMDCHSNPQQFCDRCHNYMAVNLYCWECHIDLQLLPPKVPELAVEMTSIDSTGTPDSVEVHHE